MMAANRRALSAAGALCLCAAAAALVALALVGRSSGQRSAAAALLESSSPRLAGLSRTNEDMEQIIAAADAAWAAGAGANPSLAGSDHVVVAPADMKDLFDSDLFEYLSTRCCKSLYFAPGAEQSLPTDWDVNGEEAQRVRAFVGLGNTLVFNDGKGDAIAFINKVFSAEMSSVPITSGFQLRDSLLIPGDHSSPTTIPESLSLNLPDKLPLDGSVTAVATKSLPASTTIVYNNFPREPTASPAFIIKYCQVDNPFVEGGERLSVAPVDCPAAMQEHGTPCDCGSVAFLGFDWLDAGNNVWDASTINAESLATFLAHSDPPATHPSAYVGGGGATTWVAPLAVGGAGVGGAPKTVVDRRPQGAPTFGMDPQRRDEIPEWEEQNAEKYAFWGRDGGWRDICGAKHHPVWDPLEKRFFYNGDDRMGVDDLGGQSSIYKRHWCGCWPKGFTEIETKQGSDTMGCAEMPDARRFMTPHSPRSKVGAGSSYTYTGPGYDYQRVLDRHQDMRYDERYPLFIRGYNGDGGGGVWMDENDAGPPAVIDDFHKLNKYVPRREEAIAADDARPFVPALDEPAPPAPRIWDRQGVLDAQYGTGRDLEIAKGIHADGEKWRAVSPPQDFSVERRQRPGYVDSPTEGYDSSEDYRR